jgi:transcriptional regulator with XRE-family HTH domain
MELQDQIQRFAAGLVRVRLDDGKPSYHELQRRMGYSPSTISRVLTGNSFPTWAFTEGFLHACHVAEPETNTRWRKRWVKIAELQSPVGDDDPWEDETGSDEPAPAAQVTTECGTCGALVLNVLRHEAWHATIVRREPARPARRALASDTTRTGQLLSRIPS